MNDSFSFRSHSTYLYEQPVYLASGLKYFWQNAKINIYQGSISLDLMKFLPLLRQGYSLKGTMNKLFLIYWTMNGYRAKNYSIVPDALCYNSFNSDIPALFLNRIEFGDSNNMLMSEAIETGLISKPLNTFEVIKSKDCNFSPENLNDTYINAIIFYNIYDFDTFEISNNENLIEELKIERRIVLALTGLLMLNQLSSHTSLVPLIRTSLSYMKDSYVVWATPDDYKLLLETLISDHWIYLIYGVTINDIKLVKEILQNLDPRINNSEALNVSQKLRHDQITKLIEDTIIYRRWLGQQAIGGHIRSLAGESDILDTVFRGIY